MCPGFFIIFANCNPASAPVTPCLLLILLEASDMMVIAMAKNFLSQKCHYSNAE